SDTLDKDSFLLLLVTQFKYQDPLNPMEDKEFIAQLAQFTALEQQMQTNAQMEKMVTLQTQQQMIGAVSYIGKEVSARGFGVAVSDGEASLVQYANSEEMTKGYVNIYDANSQLVSTVKLGSASPGIHDFTWDCKNASGGIVPDGVYTIGLTGENAAGENILVDTSVTGKVTGVSLSDGEQILTLSDGRMVALSYVRQVQDSSASTSKSSWTTAVKEGDAGAVWFKAPKDVASVNVTIRNAGGKTVATETLTDKK
ncbi:MAG: flagellar hook assembly protein FlgD, partial [Bilophila sp.]